MDIKELSRFLKTTGDAADIQHALEALEDGIYRTDISVGELLRNILPYEQVIVINKIAAQTSITLDDKAKAQEFFEKVREAIRALPIVQITLAIKPNATLVGLIHDWFYRTYQKSVLLDIMINPNIVAGSIISVNGKYCDCTLAKKTSQFFGGAQAQ